MAAIITSEAKCRDCYKCIRYCPVKAISINNDQAKVVEEKCILCGKCVSICPQQAKSSKSSIDIFDDFIKTKEKIAVSLAPSYLAATNYETPWKFIAVLKKIGVNIIEETAIAAEYISKEYFGLLEEKKKIISSCCPTVVSLIKKEYPSLLKYVAPIKSPILVHSELMRKRLGNDWKIVFIGPCYSKKEEPELNIGNSSLDLVLDFVELINYIEENRWEIDILADSLRDSYPDLSATKGRKYPLERGILTTAGLDDSILSNKISVSGLEAVQEVLEDLDNKRIEPDFLELLACRGGCIGGPAMGNKLGITARKNRMTEFINEFNLNKEKELDHNNQSNNDYKDNVEDNNTVGNYNSIIKMIDISKTHLPDNLKEKMPNEEEIRRILSLTGKKSVEDETNCGGCGYNSCREKAIAVYRGLAKVEMCVPYMREKAESLSHAVVDSSINGIIIVNHKMMIQEFNNSADQMFNKKNINTKGVSLKKLINTEDYQKVWLEKKMIINKYKRYEQYDLITRENIYPLEKYGVVIGLITNVTKEQKRKSEIDSMKRETLEKAEKVINKQMQAAQEIAGLLGESTAETKATLLELINIMNRSEVETDGVKG